MKRPDELAESGNQGSKKKEKNRESLRERTAPLSYLGGRGGGGGLTPAPGVRRNVANSVPEASIIFR